MLSNLQVLRGVAAMGVVFFHTDYRLAGGWHTEFFGVSTFFVISGFIMCFITRDNAEGFLAKRLQRIAPLYWLCTLVLLLVMFGGAIFDSSTWLAPLDGQPGEPLWSYVGSSLLFMPMEDRYPILNVGWSLNYEVYFYLLFATALWINQRLAPLIVIVALVALNRAGAAYCTAPACHYLSADYIQFFIAGIVLFYVVQRAPAAPRRPVVWLAVALIAICYGSQFVGPWWADAMPPGWYMALATSAPVVIVGSALVAERAGGALTWRPLILIGDASYAIYLTHPIVFEAIRLAGEKWPSVPSPTASTVFMLAYVVVAGMVGVLVHLGVELPMLRAIRGKMRAEVPVEERVARVRI